MTQHFYFYKNDATGYSGKGWAKLSSLKNHLRQHVCTIRGWDRVRRVWRLDGVEKANKFLSATVFYEVNPVTLKTTIFSMLLTEDNEWARSYE